MLPAPPIPAHAAPAPAAPGGLLSNRPPSPPVPSSLSPTPSLPSLSPTNHRLLTRLLALNEDFPALAAQLTTESAAASPPAVPCPLSTVPSDLLSLLSWSTHPNIAAWLSHYHHLQDQHSRRLAIIELESLLKTSDNPIEKRRTATTLLRALDHKWPTEPRRALVNPDRQGGARNHFAPSPPRHAPSPPSPRHKRGEVSQGSASDGEGVRSPSPQPPATPPIQNPQSKIQNHPPTPSITPSPSLTPTALASALAQDLSTGDILQTAATLAAISTPSLLSDPDTIITRLEPFLALPASTPLSPPAYHKPTPPARHACRINLSHASHTLILGFTRAHNQPWLLTSLDST